MTDVRRGVIGHIGKDYVERDATGCGACASYARPTLRGAMTDAFFDACY